MNVSEISDLCESYHLTPEMPEIILDRSKVNVLDLRRSTAIGNKQFERRLKRQFSGTRPIKQDKAWLVSAVNLKLDWVFTANSCFRITNYAGLSREVPQNVQWTDRDSKSAPLLEGVSAYVQAPGASRNYYHWMLEVLPRIGLLRDSLLSGSISRIIVDATTFAGFKRDSIEQIFPEVLPYLYELKKPVARCEKLLFFENFRGGTRVTYSALALADIAKLPMSLSSKKLYVERGSSNSRRVLLGNEQLRADLGPRGYECLEGGALTLGDQRRLFANSKTILGVHGAGLTNIVFAPRGSTLIELTSPQYVNRVTFSDFAIASGLNAIVALIDEDDSHDAVRNNFGSNLMFSDADSYNSFLSFIDKVS